MTFQFHIKRFGFILLPVFLIAGGTYNVNGKLRFQSIYAQPSLKINSSSLSSRLKPTHLIKEGALMPWFSTWDLHDQPKTRDNMLDPSVKGHLFLLFDSARFSNQSLFQTVMRLHPFLKQSKIHLILYLIGDFESQEIMNKLKRYGLDKSDVLLDRYQNFVPYLSVGEQKVIPELISFDRQGIVIKAPKTLPYLNSELLKLWFKL